ncbi:MAG: flippase-like domain-containing protein [Ignavibacteriaceae bacterium]|nr:flippase-like domain-containing protein [Ignavibacteriaceae bacterium]
MLHTLKNKIFLMMGIAGLIYLAMTLFADYENVISSFKKFSWYLFPILLVLSFLNYISRFIKWEYYLRIIDVRIPLVDSFSIFMSGLVMSVTPGKMGELLKAYLVKQITNEPISKTAPIILVERITDFVSLVLIALLGAYVFEYGQTTVIGVGLFFVLIIIILSNKSFAIKILSFFEKISFLKPLTSKFHEMYDSSYKLLKPKPLVLMTLFSFVAWGFECLGYYIILVNFDIQIPMIFLWAAFSYSFATIIGAITLLPGGLGVTDGSLTYFIVDKKYPMDVAVASTFIIRAVTLWFAVFVGVVSVLLYQKRFGKITFSLSENENK